MLYHASKVKRNPASAKDRRWNLSNQRIYFAARRLVRN